MLKFENIERCGTCLQGYYESPWSFEETVARLARATGQKFLDAGDGYKVSVEFTGTWNGQPFTLYDYKEDRTIHVGGNSGLPVPPLSEALTEALSKVDPLPYDAAEHYDHKAGHRYP